MIFKSDYRNTMKHSSNFYYIIYIYIFRVWNYIKYIKNKTTTCAKETYKIDLGMHNKNYIFKDCELGIKLLIEENVKKSQ